MWLPLDSMYHSAYRESHQSQCRLAKLSHTMQLLVLLILLSSATYQIINMKYDWNGGRCKVLPHCSSISETIIACTLLFFVHFQWGYLRSKMFSFYVNADQFQTVLQVLQIFGILVYMFLFCTSIFWIKVEVKESGEIGHEKCLIDKVTSWHQFLFVIAAFVAVSELTTFLLFALPICQLYRAIEGHSKLKREASLHRKRLKCLVLRSGAFTVPPTLFSAVYLVFWGLSPNDEWDSFRPYTMFFVMGFVQYLSMSLSYTYWDYILCPCVLFKNRRQMREGMPSRAVSLAIDIKRENEKEDFTVRNGEGMSFDSSGDLVSEPVNSVNIPWRGDSYYVRGGSGWVKQWQNDVIWGSPAQDDIKFSLTSNNTMRLAQTQSFEPGLIRVKQNSVEGNNVLPREKSDNLVVPDISLGFKPKSSPQQESSRITYACGSRASAGEDNIINSNCDECDLLNPLGSEPMDSLSRCLAPSQIPGFGGNLVSRSNMSSLGFRFENNSESIN